MQTPDTQGETQTPATAKKPRTDAQRAAARASYARRQAENRAAYLANYARRAGLREAIRLRLLELVAAGYDSPKLAAAFRNEEDLFGVLPMSPAMFTDFVGCLSDLHFGGTAEGLLLVGLHTRCADFRFGSFGRLTERRVAKQEDGWRAYWESDRQPAPAPRLVHVSGEKFANRGLDTAFLTRTEEEEDTEYDLAA